LVCAFLPARVFMCSKCCGSRELDVAEHTGAEETYPTSYARLQAKELVSGAKSWTYTMPTPYWSPLSESLFEWGGDSHIFTKPAKDEKQEEDFEPPDEEVVFEWKEEGALGLRLLPKATFNKENGLTEDEGGQGATGIVVAGVLKNNGIVKSAAGHGPVSLQAITGMTIVSVKHGNGAEIDMRSATMGGLERELKKSRSVANSLSIRFRPNLQWKPRVHKFNVSAAEPPAPTPSAAPVPVPAAAEEATEEV